MTISNFIEWINAHPNPIFVYMIIVPAASFIAAMFLEDSAARAPGKYIFSALMYAACVPGVLAVVLTGYTLIIRREDILNVNVLVYFLPIISMALSIAIISRVVRMPDIPGFKRLSGFMLMIGVAFVLVFILQRLFFGVVFFGTLQSLLVLFVIIFVLLKIAWEKLSS